jgi:hypothetical protein
MDLSTEPNASYLETEMWGIRAESRTRLPFLTHQRIILNLPYVCKRLV